jgi:hypothetical protein
MNTKYVSPSMMQRARSLNGTHRLTGRVSVDIIRLKKATHRLANNVGDDTLTRVLDEYRDALENVGCLATWVDYHNDGEDTMKQDISARAADHLITTATYVCEEQQKEMRTALEAQNYVIDDSTMLPSITNAGPRIELVGTCRLNPRTPSIERAIQVFWPLIELIIGHQAEVIGGKTSSNGAQLAAQWQMCQETLTLLTSQLDRRYQSLLRGWRSQKLDVHTEAQHFAGGFFWGWHKEVCLFPMLL